jgi:hypothetical protein
MVRIDRKLWPTMREWGHLMGLLGLVSPLH